MDSNKFKCKSHKSTLVCFCLHSSCTNRMCCSKCIAFNHPTCEQNFIFIEDIKEKKIDSFLRLSITTAIFTESEINSMSQTDDTPGNMNEMVAMQFSNFLDQFSNKLMEFQEQLEERVAQDMNTVDYVDKIKRVLGLDHFTQVLEAQDASQLEKELDELDLINNIDVIKDNLYEMKEEMSSSVNRFEVQKSLSTAFDNILKQLSKNLSMQNLFDKKKARFDASLTSTKIELFGDNMQAIKDGNLSYTGTLLNFEMEPMSGIYKWSLQMGGLSVTQSHTDNQWICFGIVSKEYWGNLENFNYSNTIGISTFFQLYGNIKITNNQINKVFEDKIFNCIYDSNKGAFSIIFKDKFLAEAEVKSGVYKPFVILYGTGNTVKII